MNVVDMSAMFTFIKCNKDAIWKCLFTLIFLGVGGGEKTLFGGKEGTELVDYTSTHYFKTGFLVCWLKNFWYFYEILIGWLNLKVSNFSTNNLSLLEG